MLNDINILRLINVTLALLSLYPSIRLATTLFKERNQVSSQRKRLNSILVISFLSFAVVATFNALLSFILYYRTISDITVPQVAFNVRNLVSNMSITIVSWGLWISVNRRVK